MGSLLVCVDVEVNIFAVDERWDVHVSLGGPLFDLRPSSAQRVPFVRRNATINTTITPSLMVLLERCALRFRSDGRRLVRRVLLAPDPFVAALRLAWVALVVWGEIGVFFYALAGCRWPVPEKVRR